MGQTTLAMWLRKPYEPATSTPPTTSPNFANCPGPHLSHSTSEDSDPPPSDMELPGLARSSRTITTEGYNVSKPGEAAANVRIETCTQTHLKSFRRLLALLLPIPYPDSFYRQTVEDTVIASLTRIALWDETSRLSRVAGPGVKPTSHTQLVAAIRCRIIEDDQRSADEQASILYISALATLSAFRERGLASRLLRDVTTTAVNDYGARAVMAHVWDQNDEALAWYKGRGFTVVGKEDHYYRRLAPHTTALVIRREVQPSDLLPRPGDAA